MSVSKWAYEPEICDGDICSGECDHCPKKYNAVYRKERRQQHEDFRVQIEKYKNKKGDRK